MSYEDGDRMCDECGEMTEADDLKSFAGQSVCAWCFENAGYYATGEDGYDGD